jgi:predicted ribosomally synthesized peptide with SipW-like signal peptide
MKKSEAKKKKKKIMLIATLSTAAIIVGGLTFAWYTSRDSVTNTFQASGNLKTVVVENFTPPTNWQPGVVTDKVVQVTNTGTIDAYTRVNLVHKLTYLAKSADGAEALTAVGDDKKIAAVAIAPTLTPTTYFTVNKDAIDATAANYKDVDGSDGEYVELTQTKLAGITDTTDPLYPLKDKLFIPDNVKLYVKATSGDSDISNTNASGDSATVETGYNYDFLGYATDADGNAYEITISPSRTDIDYTTDVTYGAPITSSIDEPLIISVYKATQVELKLNGINNNENSTTKDAETDWATFNKLVQLDFYDDAFNDENNQITDLTAGTNWYYRNGYFYYNSVLESGATTKPLLKSVTYKSDFDGKIGDLEVTDIVYKLTVENVSTQATVTAAVDTFVATDDKLTEDQYKTILGTTSSATKEEENKEDNGTDERKELVQDEGVD